MGVALELINFDELFFTYSTKEPIIINNVAEGSEIDKEAFNAMIYTKYNTDLLSNLPTCECQEIKGEHNVGVKCKACGTHVKAPLEQNLEPLVWIKSPKEVEKLINPILWTMLCDKFTKSNFDIIRWICDTNYQAPVKVPPIMEAVQSLQIPRGYNSFVQNFDNIIANLFNIKGFRERKGVEDPLETLIREQRNCVFSDYLPLPNRSLLVIEETNVGTYVDPIVTGAVDAIRTMCSIDSPLQGYTTRVKENRTIKAIAQLAMFYDDLKRSTLAKKEGIFRKHVFSCRSHFSFRAVISSLTDKHRYDEIHIPWGIGVSVLRIHLMNKLLRRGFGINEAIAFLNEHSQKYHPLLEELFTLLIEESPYPGLPLIFQRNPSLERASAQAMFATKVKNDPSIPTVSLSILSVVGFNADFDGDQLNATLSLDHCTTEDLNALAPHKSVFDLNTPKIVSKNPSMPKPVVATISHWVHSEEPIDPVKLARMEELAMR